MNPEISNSIGLDVIRCNCRIKHCEWLRVSAKTTRGVKASQSNFECRNENQSDVQFIYHLYKSMLDKKLNLNQP